MKSISAIVLLILLLTSCGSLPHFEKRLYRPGFYVERNELKGKSTVNSDTISHLRNNIEKEAFFVPVKYAEIRETSFCSQIHADYAEMAQNDLIGNGNEKSSKTFRENKSSQKNIHETIDLPKGEPVNKKARAAYILLNIARLFFVSAFVLLLCSLLTPFFIVAGISAVFALFAILFGVLAKRQIANEDPTVRELGSKKAEYAIQHAVAGLVYFTLLILLAILVDWLDRKNGH